MMPQPTKSRETAASFQHFERMGKMRIEAFWLHRVQHIPNMAVARNLHHPKQRLAIRATMAVPVREVPLMGQERRALHEKRRKRRHADMAITYWMFFPRRLSGRPAQVARSPDIRSSIVPTRRLNQTRPDLQIARMLPIQSVAPPLKVTPPPK